MPWNWQLPKWPNFNYNPTFLEQEEKEFLLNAGSASAYVKNMEKQERDQFIVEILSSEGVESSKIEGEILDRQSVQSSIKKHFGLHAPKQSRAKKESSMAELLCNVYATFEKPLTHEMLYQWHSILFRHSLHIEDLGKYRTHLEPMQIVSNRYGNPTIFFEAPPSANVFSEMMRFIEWFNATQGAGSILLRAAIAHVYFESIHPFEDGNGRIGRILVEKILSQGIGHPVLISVSQILEHKKTKYYSELGKCNTTLDIQNWIEFFSHRILEAQRESMNLLYFLIEKAKMFVALSGQINSRQEKALLRMFAEGLNGFKGGLSADNYLKITKTTRATATRDLIDLVEKGALIKTGERRHTRYWLNLEWTFQTL